MTNKVNKKMQRLKIIFTVAIMCTGVTNARAVTESWQNFTSPDWGFSASFPAAVQTKKQTNGERFGTVSDFDMYLIQATPRSETTKDDIKDLAEYTTKATLKGTHTNPKTGAEVTVECSSIKDISEAKLLGKEFEIKTTIKQPVSSQPKFQPELNCTQNGLGRIWMTKQAFYTLSVSPMNPEVHNCSAANATKFFKSFVVKQ